MRTLLLSAALIVCSLCGSSRPLWADDTGAAMADAARRFLAALDDDQKARATFPFDSPERLNWHWIPRERKGLPLKDLTPEQRCLAFGLLDTGLSTRGMLRATTIMSLEEILRIEEHGTGPIRDPELYFVSVFGAPGDAGDWGWRIEGHHLSLNFTLRGGRVVSATPFMFGSNPAQVRDGRRKGLRNLVEIEDPANKLLLSLSGEQRRLAIVSADVPDVTTTPNPAQAPRTEPAGISSDQLDSAQRESLSRFIHAYAQNFPDPIRTQLLNEIARDGQRIHFAWYGPADPAQPHAFKVQGETFFIDFNDKQNGANHIHTYFRSLLGDFGMPPGK